MFGSNGDSHTLYMEEYVMPYIRYTPYVVSCGNMRRHPGVIVITVHCLWWLSGVSVTQWEVFPL